jgi:hypothetical protein
VAHQHNPSFERIDGHAVEALQLAASGEQRAVVVRRTLLKLADRHPGRIVLDRASGMYTVVDHWWRSTNLFHWQRLWLKIFNETFAWRLS